MPTETNLKKIEHRGQLGMADTFANHWEGKLIYVYGVGWHYWDKQRWALDEIGKATLAVKKTLKKVLVASMDSNLDSDAQKAMRTDVRKCESAPGIRGVLSLAESDPAFAAHPQAFDADPYLINLANGIFDLRDDVLYPHDPNSRQSKMARGAYDPENTSMYFWNQFMAEVLPDEADRKFLQRYVGTALCGATLEHKLVILCGRGRNGKSRFYEAVSHALGDYAVQGNKDLFMNKKGEHPTGLMDLMGRRWAVVSETGRGNSLDEPLVKSVTGGDKIRARYMHKDFIEFDPTHTPVLVTNHLPRVSGDDQAIWDRLRIVSFNQRFEDADQKKDLGEILRLHADAIVAWAVEGWREYREIGLAEPASVLRATQEYRDTSDDLTQFLADCCELEPASKVSVGELSDAWDEWHQEQRLDSPGGRELKRLMEAHDFEQGRNKNERFWKGLHVIWPDDQRS